MNTYTIKIDKENFTAIEAFLKSKNAEFSTQQYAIFRAKLPCAIIVLYSSGKLLIQGKDVTTLVQELHTALGLNNQEKIHPAELNIINNLSDEPHIGVDESGKGDYFGPLVIAGVLADKTNTAKFIESGVKDSKKLTNEKILKLAGIIKANSIHTVVIIGNEKYNELYTKFNNLNKLLAWGHARVIENILEKQSCKYALSDKFGNENLIKNALLEKGRNITLEQRIRGEEDIAVAAASILARAEYVKRMNTLCNKYELNLPKGASNLVLETAKKFVSLYGKDKLNLIAKLHFRTTSQL